MNTREEAIKYGLSFANTYVEAPFRDQNWQLVRVKGSKKAFLWVYSFECESRAGVERLLERGVFISYSGVSPE